MAMDYDYYFFRSRWTIKEGVQLLFTDYLSYEDMSDYKTLLHHNEKDRYAKVFGAVLDLIEEDVKAGVLRPLNSGEYRIYHFLDYEVGKDDFLKYLQQKIIPFMKLKGMSPSERLGRFIEETKRLGHKETLKPFTQENGNAEVFIKSLRIYCENDVEIKIQEPGKKPRTFSFENCGFNSSNTNEWKALLKILRQVEPIFEYGENRDADKKLLQRLEEKLKLHLGKEYSLEFPEGFKLYENIGKGTFKFKFQCRGGKENPKLDFSEFSTEKLKESLKNIQNDEKKMQEDVATVKELRNRGVSDDEIESIINFEKLRRGGND